MTNALDAKVLFTTSIGIFLISGCTADPRGGNERLGSAHENVGPTLTDDTLRKATQCDGCAIVGHGHVALPLTGRSYTEAKLTSSDGLRTATIALDDATGDVVDTGSLQRVEQSSRFARQGRLTDELYAVSQSSSAGLVPVWIWTNANESRPRRDTLLRDAAARAKNEADRLATLHGAAAPVTAWLDARGFATYERGDHTPLIDADVPASALAELGRLAAVASVGYRAPGQEASTVAWYDTVKSTSAQGVVGSANGVTFCNMEGNQPSSYAWLSVPSSQIASATAPGGWHIQWTTELIASTQAPYRMAP